MISIKQELIAVEISDIEADVFRKMREAGCFDVIGGKCVLNFDTYGKLSKIEKTLYTPF